MYVVCPSFFFFFNDTATTEIYTLSLHDALPISHAHQAGRALAGGFGRQRHALQPGGGALHGVCHAQQLSAGLRGPPLARFALEEHGPQLLFQGLDAARHRGVLHAQLPRGGGHAAAARQLAKESQVVPVHGSRPPQSAAARRAASVLGARASSSFCRTRTAIMSMNRPRCSCGSGSSMRCWARSTEGSAAASSAAPSAVTESRRTRRSAGLVFRTMRPRASSRSMTLPMVEVSKPIIRASVRWSTPGWRSTADSAAYCTGVTPNSWVSSMKTATAICCRRRMW